MTCSAAGRVFEVGLVVFTAASAACGLSQNQVIPDDDQAVALAVALQLATSSGAGFEEAAARGPDHGPAGRFGRRIDTLRVTTVRRPEIRPGPHVEDRVLMALSAAAHAQEVLRFDYSITYVSGAGDQRTDIVPAVFASGGASSRHHLGWSLAPRRADLDRLDWRIYRIDRITPRPPSGPRFAPRELPGGDVAAFVSGRFQGSDDGSTGWPCRGEVILGLPAAVVLTYTRESLVHALGRSAAGSCSGHGPGLPWPPPSAWFDADIEVIGPPELSAAFAQLARRHATAATGGTATPTAPAASR